MLENARMLGSDEFMELISYVRFGASAGLLDIPVERINALITDMQPATIAVSDEEASTVAKRDARRAELVRQALAG